MMFDFDMLDIIIWLTWYFDLTHLIYFFDVPDIINWHTWYTDYTYPICRLYIPDMQIIHTRYTDYTHPICQLWWPGILITACFLVNFKVFVCEGQICRKWSLGFGLRVARLVRWISWVVFWSRVESHTGFFVCWCLWTLETWKTVKVSGCWWL